MVVAHGANRFYLHKDICLCRKEFGHGIGFPSHFEALAEQWGGFVVSRRARAGTLVPCN